MTARQNCPDAQHRAGRHAPAREDSQPDIPARGAPLPGLALAPQVRRMADVEVGAVNDIEEVQADEVAESVVGLLRARAGGAAASPPAGNGAPSQPAVRRSPADVGAAGGSVTESTAGMIAGLRRSGQPLSAVARSMMESALGADLGDVRVSVGARAAEANDRVQARAFTVGNNVVFRDGMPDVGTEAGQRLLAHELAHVVQNTGGNPIAAMRRMASTARTRSEPGTPEPGTPEPRPRPLRRQSTLRRLVGFEVELSVPTFDHNAGLALGDSGSGNLPDAAIGSFFAGGLPYAHPIGTLPSPAGNIDLKADHNALQRHALALYTTLRALNNALLPAGGYVPLSNLEYSTPALDELAPGSNAQFQALATAIDAHALALFNANPTVQESAIANGNGELTGVPAQSLLDWMPPHQHAGFAAQLNTLTGAVRWDMYLQATVGILPTGLNTMYASQAAGLPVGAPGPAGRKARAKTDAATAVNNAAAAITLAPFWAPAVAGLANGDVEALRGAVTIAISYAIGNAMGQTDLVGGTQKNAVQMLVKMQNIGDVAALANTVVVRGLAGHAGMPAFIAAAAAFIAALPQATLAYWTGPAHGGVQNRPAIVAPGATPLAAVTGMLSDLLTGTNVAAAIGSGNPIPGPDPVSPTIAGPAVAGQLGVPMELRWIAAHPNAPGALWPALLAVLTEVRNANLVHLPALQRAPILAAL